jgi:hypothetical protein
MATNSSGTTIEIAQWLRELGLEQYTDAFHENAIDAKILPTLTADDLRDIGVTLIGHRRRLLNAIADWGKGHHELSPPLHCPRRRHQNADN